MDPIARFAELVAVPESQCALDVAAFTFAAAFDSAADPAAGCAELDALAAEVREPTVDAVCSVLFGRESFRGDVVSYDDPQNSLLHRVLARRRGIPITLAVITIEVARRAGLALEGVGMPGHFLVGVPAEHFGDRRWLDVFAGGQSYDADEIEAWFCGRSGQRWTPAYLLPVGPHAMLGRMLANLQGIHCRPGGDRTAALTTLRLRLAVPGVRPAERRQMAEALAALGAFDEAARALDALAAEVDPEGDGGSLRDSARRMRARMN